MALTQNILLRLALCTIQKTFLLIMTESAATDLLLNFTAIEFVTNLDNIFFWLCAWGYLGTEAQGDAARIISASPNHIMIAKREVLKGDKRKVVKRFSAHRSLEMGEKLGDETSLRMMRQKTKRPPKIPRLTTLLVLCLAVISGWFIIYWRQRTGYYVCNYVYAEFSDLIAPEYAAFNGLYELVTDGGIRNEYIEVGHGKYSKTARFAYCGAETAWTFNHAGNDGALLDICQWQVKSSDIHHQSEESYDMVGSDSEQWFIKDHHGRTLPLTNVIIQCFDCRNDPDFCGEQGTCVVSTIVSQESMFQYTLTLLSRRIVAFAMMVGTDHAARLRPLAIESNMIRFFLRCKAIENGLKHMIF